MSATTYGELLERVREAARAKESALVDHMPVHGVVEAASSERLGRAMNAFSAVAPDGQPVRWALKWLYGVTLPDRVYGPEFMKRVCGDAAAVGYSVYLYGGSPRAVANLKANLEERYPRLAIVGCESPPYRELSAEEDVAMCARVNASGAGVLFLGLGCPKQEVFAYDHRESIRCVQICVGAAFDFLSGEKAMAPKWMQARGLEWVYRLMSEPRRLLYRYVWSNSKFAWLVGRQLLGKEHSDDGR